MAKERRKLTASEKGLVRRTPLRAGRPPRSRKKSLMAQIEARLTALVAEVVKWRDGWKCQRCRRPVRGGPGARDCCDEAHAHHIENRGRGKVLRWVLVNLLTLCPKCHDWAHACPLDFEEWFRQAFPSRWSFIQKHKHEIRKFTEDELLEMERVNQDELLRLGGDAWTL